MSRKIVIAALLAAGTVTAGKAMAVVQCAVDPFQEDCCPEPCPVLHTLYDAGLAEQLMTAQGGRSTAWKSINDDWSTMNDRFGANSAQSGPVPTSMLKYAPQQLSTLPALGNVPAAADALNTALGIKSTGTTAVNEPADFDALKAIWTATTTPAAAAAAASVTVTSSESFVASNGASFPTATARGIGSTVSRAYAVYADATAANAALDNWASLQDATTSTRVSAPSTVSLVPLVNPPSPYTPSVSVLSSNPSSQMWVVAGANNQLKTLTDLASDNAVLQATIKSYQAVQSSLTTLQQTLTNVLRGHVGNPQATAAAILATAGKLDTTSYTDSYNSGPAANAAAAAATQSLTRNRGGYISSVETAVVNYLQTKKLATFLYPLAVSAQSEQQQIAQTITATQQRYGGALSPQLVAQLATSATAAYSGNATATQALTLMASAPGSQLILSIPGALP